MVVDERMGAFQGKLKKSDLSTHAHIIISMGFVLYGIIIKYHYKDTKVYFSYMHQLISVHFIEINSNPFVLD